VDSHYFSKSLVSKVFHDHAGFKFLFNAALLLAQRFDPSSQAFGAGVFVAVFGDE